MGALIGRAWAQIAAVGAALAGLAAIYLRGRADARRSAELEARRAEDARRKEAEHAAREYHRAGGADRRLRDGRF